MERFNEIQQHIKNNDSIKPDDKEHVVSLLDELKEETQNLDNPSLQDRVITSTQISTKKVLEKEATKEEVELSLKSLTQSVEEFEASHPRLVKIVNSISVALANIGI